MAKIDEIKEELNYLKVWAKYYCGDYHKFDRLVVE